MPRRQFDSTQNRGRILPKRGAETQRQTVTPFTIKPALNSPSQCGHVLLTTEKIRAPVISDKKDRTIEGEIAKKDDDYG
jgi:hypothetical protein